MMLFFLCCLLSIFIFVVLVGVTIGGKVSEFTSLTLVFFETMFWIWFEEWWIFFSSSTCKTSWTKSSNTWFKMKHKNDHENWRHCSSDIKCWLEYEHTVCFVSELGFSSVVFNFLNSSITRGPPIPFSFLKYWLTFSLISSTVEKSTFLSSSAALLARWPSVVPINDMLDSYWMFEEFQS